MKDSQWAVAVGALAVLVFVVVFAGQYLGSGPADRGGEGQPAAARREVKFSFKDAPDGYSEAKDPLPPPPIEVEEKQHSHTDFYFLNENAETVRVGLSGANCRCTDAQLVVLPGDGMTWAARTAVTLLAHGPGGGLPAAVAWRAGMDRLEQAAAHHELKKDGDGFDVPGKAAGWVRIGWHAERPGPQALEAKFWMDDRLNGLSTTVTGRAFTHSPIRHRPALAIGTLREAEMGSAKGAVHDLIVFSSTRPSFRVEVRAAGRTDPKSDPLEIGTPVALSAAERRELERANNVSEGMPGMVTSAWRVPLKFRAVAPDGKTPFEIGPFRRKLLVSSPDVEGEPQEVLVAGRVRGVVEIGNDDEGGEVSFRTFSRRAGKTEVVNLRSDVPNLDLKVDTARTAKFLDVTVGPARPAGPARWEWKLTVTVRPGAASGMFPRRDDPAYEDAAVYLIGTAPGQTPRAVRIAVTGLATAG